jgi:DnaJ-class molecular chaperone
MGSNNSKQIIICERCNGNGTEYKPILAQPVKYVTCEACNGSGRLVKETTVKYYPFKNNNNE